MKKVPVGMSVLSLALKEICRDGKNRRNRGLPIPPLLLPLDSGNGRTTVLHYIGDIFEDSGRLEFKNLDRVFELELSLNESSSFEDAIDEVFYRIDSMCVYSNPIDGFDGVVAIDISNLEEYTYESAIKSFAKNIELRRKNTAFVFFVSSEISADTKNMITKLQKYMPSVRLINLQDYSVSNLTRIAERISFKYGVTLESDETRVALKKFISDCDIDSVQFLENLVCEIIMTMNNSDVLTTETIKNLHSYIKGGKQ